MLEVVHGRENNDPSQRRPDGHAVTGSTKKGNKKRCLRVRPGSLDEDLDVDEEDEDDM